MTDLSALVAELPDRSLLILDDDAPLRTRLGRALESRGFGPVTLAATLAEAVSAVKAAAPAYAVLDMRLEDGSGLSVVETIQGARPDARVIMLTGYGNIASAVQEGAAPWRGVDQEDADLRVLPASGRAAVLALHPDGLGPLLEEARLVDDQHGAVVAQVLHDVGAEVIPHGVRVPARRVQQALHAAGVPLRHCQVRGG